MMSQLLSWSFWFTNSPVSFSPVFNYVFFSLFALCALGAVILRILSKRSQAEIFTREAMGMGATACLTLAIFGFAWFFSTYEEAPVFGVRAWFLLWLFIAAAFIFRIGWYLKKEVPVIREKRASRANVNKYLPRR